MKAKWKAFWRIWRRASKYDVEGQLPSDFAKLIGWGPFLRLVTAPDDIMGQEVPIVLRREFLKYRKYKRLFGEADDRERYIRFFQRIRRRLAENGTEMTLEKVAEGFYNSMCRARWVIFNKMPDVYLYDNIRLFLYLRRRGIKWRKF